MAAANDPAARRELARRRQRRPAMTAKHEGATGSASTQATQSPPPLPGIIKRAGRYTKAVSKWIAAGRPTRSQDEIDALLAICQTCRQYNAQHAACAKCGCSVNNQASGLANKLAMVTEHCPLEKW